VNSILMTDTQYDYIELQLDSSSASRSDSSVYSRNNPLFTLGRQISNVTGIKVMEVEIPFSYYILDGSNDDTQLPNNRLSVNYDTTNIALIGGYITIAPGMYTATTLVNELNSQFLALQIAEAANFPPYTGSPIVASFSSTTGKITFTVASGGNNFTIGENSGFQRPIYNFLGFSNGAFSAVAGSGGSYSVKAPYAAQITGSDYLYVNSTVLGPLTKCWLPESSITKVVGQTNPQIAKISVNCNPGGVITWSDPDPNYWFDTQNLFQLLNIDLYLTLGNDQKPLDLNGLPFSVKLALQVNTNQLNQGYAGTTGQDRVSKRVRMV
jgi:hypothetical protein